MGANSELHFSEEIALNAIKCRRENSAAFCEIAVNDYMLSDQGYHKSLDCLQMFLVGQRLSGGCGGGGVVAVSQHTADTKLAGDSALPNFENFLPCQTSSSCKQLVPDRVAPERTCACARLGLQEVRE